MKTGLFLHQRKLKLIATSNVFSLHFKQKLLLLISVQHSILRLVISLISGSIKTRIRSCQCWTAPQLSALTNPAPAPAPALGGDLGGRGGGHGPGDQVQVPVYK